MVFDKKRSGDPDYDDKVPIADQLGEKVTGPDGQEATIFESLGPVDDRGRHVNLDAPADDRDNRPAPGGVAKEASEVQVNQTDPRESGGKSTK